MAEAYQKYLTDKPYSGLISEGIKQVTHPLCAHRLNHWGVITASNITLHAFLLSLTSSLQVSYLASVLRLGVSPEASFSQWAWQLLLRLKLHGNAQNPKGAWSVPALTSNPPPELTHTPSMHSVIRAVKAGIPIGCYLSIAMTTVGHRFVLMLCLMLMLIYTFDWFELSWSPMDFLFMIFLVWNTFVLMESGCWRIWFSLATWELLCIFWTTSYPQPTLSASTCSITLSKKDTSFTHSL